MLCLNMEALKAREFASGVGRGRGNGCAVSEDHESRDWWVLNSSELVSATLLPFTGLVASGKCGFQLLLLSYHLPLANGIPQLPSLLGLG